MNGIVESDPERGAKMLPPPQALEPSTDDPKARLLVPDEPNSSAVDSETSNGDSQGFSPVLSWDESHRFGKRFEGLPALDTLEVMRESSRLLRRQTDVFTTLAAVLVVPVSVVILTHILVTRPLIDWVEARFEVGVFMLDESMGVALQSRYSKFVYLKLAEFLVTSVLCIPLAITLAALSKAGVVYTVACTYGGLEVSFVEVMQRVVPHLWLPLVITYGCSLLFFLASGLVLFFFLGIASGLFAAFHPSASITLFFMALLGLGSCGIFVYLKIILNVANVICVVEDIYGFAAFERSYWMLQGRVLVALCSYLVTFLCGGFVTLLFEYRVTDRNDYTEYNSSGAWEGPLLVLMHSFVYLFDDIMASVVYFTCPKSSNLEDFHRHRISGHISVALT